MQDRAHDVRWTSVLRRPTYKTGDGSLSFPVKSRGRQRTVPCLTRKVDNFRSFCAETPVLLIPYGLSGILIDGKRGI